MNPFKDIWNKITKNGERLFKASSDIHTAYKYQQLEKLDKCLVVDGSFIHEVDGKVKNGEWIEPEGFDVRVKIDHVLIKRPENIKTYLINLDFPCTFHPKDEPIVEEIHKITPKRTHDKDGKELVTYNTERFNVYGGRFLNEVAKSIGELGLMLYVFKKSQKELLVIAVAMLGLGVLIGMFIGLLFSALFF